MPEAESHRVSLARAATGGRDLVGMAVRYLQDCDEVGLLSELRAHWTLEELVSLLHSSSDDMVKVAATCLGMVGSYGCCPALAATLHHPDSVVVSVAELALWQIWFRSGPPDACGELHHAARLMAEDRYDAAVAALDGVIAAAPEYAEAYNQRAIAGYLDERFPQAAADCRQAVRLNPTHFAALAGLGHCFAQLGRYRDALGAYRGALRIHPRMAGVRQSIRQIRSVLGGHDGVPAR